MGRLSQGKAGTDVEIPLGRQGEATDIAGMCAFLFSQEASWITGQVFVRPCSRFWTQTAARPGDERER